MPPPYTPTTTTHANSTGPTINLPSVSAGDLMVLLVGWDGAPSQINMGLFEVANGGMGPIQAIASRGSDFSIAAYARKCTGSEPSTFNPTWTNNEQGAWQVFRIPAADWHGTTAPEAASPVIQDTNTANDPDCPALSPSWGSENTIWLAYSSRNTGGSAATAAPTNYTGLVDTASGAGTGTGSVASAWRQVTTATEDPDTFDLPGSNIWIAGTLAIRPAVVTGLDLVRLVPETVALPENAQRTSGLFHVVAETQTLSEAVDRIQGLAHVVGETVPIASASAAPRQLGRIADESLEISSLDLGSRALLRLLAETVAASEDAQRTGGLFHVVDETDAISETTLSLLGRVQFALETLGITEDAQRAGGLLEIIAETVGLTEDEVVSRALTRLLLETSVVTEGVLVLRSLVTSLTETVGLEEAVERVSVLVQVLDESASLTEQTLQALGQVHILVETLGLTEQTLSISGLVHAVAETLGITETEAITLGLAIVHSEDVGLAEALIVAAGLAFVQDETMEVTEDAQQWIPGLIDRVELILEVLGIREGDDDLYHTAWSWSAPETFMIEEEEDEGVPIVAVRAMTRTQTITEGVVLLAEGVVRSVAPVVIPIVNETVAVTEATLGSLGLGLTQLVAETEAITETVSESLALGLVEIHNATVAVAESVLAVLTIGGDVGQYPAAWIRHLSGVITRSWLRFRRY